MAAGMKFDNNDPVVARASGTTAAGKLTPEQRFMQDVNLLVDRTARVMRQYAVENGISQETAAYAVTMLYLNTCADFPKELGGKDKFLEIAAAAEAYFKSQTGG
jgi:hypothetical protein